MDNTHISSTEPSSVILSQTEKLKKLTSDAQKVSNQAKAKRNGAINLQNYNFNQFLKNPEKIHFVLFFLELNSKWIIRAQIV